MSFFPVGSAAMINWVGGSIRIEVRAALELMIRIEFERLYVQEGITRKEVWKQSEDGMLNMSMLVLQLVTVHHILITPGNTSQHAIFPWNDSILSGDYPGKLYVGLMNHPVVSAEKEDLQQDSIPRILYPDTCGPSYPSLHRNYSSAHDWNHIQRLPSGFPIPTYRDWLETLANSSTALILLEKQGQR